MKLLSLRLAEIVVVASLFLMLPLLVHAQSADLDTTIRAALSSDPRTATMSQAQIDAMVAALSQRAQQQGLTPGDITWRPLPTSSTAPTSVCAGFPAYLCTINTAFGFQGPDYFIPIWLAACALLFLLINALQAHHRRLPDAAAGGLTRSHLQS
jgi:hypothetical protein